MPDNLPDGCSLYDIDVAGVAYAQAGRYYCGPCPICDADVYSEYPDPDYANNDGCDPGDWDHALPHKCEVAK